jgi:hypothetical protein
VAVEIASLRAVLSLDKDNFDKGLTGVKKQMSDFGKGFGAGLGIPTDAFSLGAVAATAFTAALTDSVAAAREATMINKDLEQTIKSTGGAAGITADAARDLADKLSGLTNFEDDAIVKGEAMLLTFTNIGKDVFPAATEAMLDMAQKFGSMDSASIQLGKALNDPIAGISALTRVGVTFSDMQKQQIKDFMAVNDIAGAQGVILAELAKEFGGQAQAAADPWIQLQNALGNIQEALGMGIIPLLNGVAQAALPAAQAIGQMAPMFQALGEGISNVLGPALQLLGPAMKDLVSGADQLAKAINAMQVALGMSESRINGFTVLLAPMTAILQGVGYVFKAVAAVAQGLAVVIQGLTSTVNMLKSGWTTLSASMSGVNSIGGRISQMWTTIQTGMAGVFGWIGKMITAWQQMVTTLSQNIQIPDWLTPGSPTPFEMGLRGITSAIKQMPPIGGGMVASGAGAGGVSNVTNLNMGGQSFSFSGQQGKDQAMVQMVQLLRGMLESAG